MRVLIALALLSCVFGTLLLPDHIPDRDEDIDPTFVPDPAPDHINLSNKFKKFMLHKDDPKPAVVQQPVIVVSPPKSVDKVHEHLVAIHTELARLFAEMEDCHDEECKEELKRHIEYEKQSEELLENARDHIALGKWYRRTSECMTPLCVSIGEAKITNLERKIDVMHAEVLDEDDESKKQLEDAYEEEQAEEGPRDTPPPSYKPRRLTPAQKKEKNRLGDLADHFHELGDALQRAGTCRNQKCRDSVAKEIKILRKEGKQMRRGTEKPKKMSASLKSFRRRMAVQAKRHSNLHNMYQRATLCNNRKCLNAHKDMIRAVEKVHLPKQDYTFGASVDQLAQRGDLHDKLSKLYTRASHCRSMKCLTRYQEKIRHNIELVHSSSHVVETNKGDEKEDDDSESQDTILEKEEKKVDKAIAKSHTESLKDHYPYHHGYIHHLDEDEEEAHHSIHEDLLDNPLHFHPRLPNLHNLDHIVSTHQDEEVHDHYMPVHSDEGLLFLLSLLF